MARVATSVLSLKDATRECAARTSGPRLEIKTARLLLDFDLCRLKLITEYVAQLFNVAINDRLESIYKC